MEKIRYAVVGTGWRAMFFIRAAKNLPELFEVTGVLTRTKERAQEFECETGVKAFTDMDEMLKTKPEFVVSCVNKAGMAQMVMELLHRGMPTLSETPYATDRETLERLIAVQKETGVLLDCAEQYFLYPTHQAKYEVLRRGVLGAVVS